MASCACTSRPVTGRFALADQAMAAQFWAVALAECESLQQAGKLTERALPAAAAAPPVEPTAAAAQTEPTAAAAQTEPAAAAPGNDHWAVRDPRWDDLAASAPGSAARTH